MSDLIKTLHKKGDTSTNIYPNIKRDNIPTHAINNDKLDVYAVGTNNINDLAVTTAKLMDECVTTTKISDLAVTRSKIGYEAVGEDEIGEKQVKTYHLADECVTEDKLYNGAVTTDKLSFSLYYYTATIEYTSNFSISFEVYSTEYLDVNNATKSEWLALLFKVWNDAYIYRCGVDLVNNVKAVFLVNMDDNETIKVNGTNVTNNISFIDGYRSTIF